MDQSVSESELKEILSANYEMLDRIGIAQHHDAVTGTAKDRVADDYSHKLFTGLSQNIPQYSKMIKEKVVQMAGIESTNEWTMCKKDNTTFMDCPIADMYKKNLNTFTMSIAVHNPSSLHLSEPQFHVPIGEYKAFGYNTASQAWEEVPSTINCFLDINWVPFANCKLSVKHGVAPRDVSLLKIEYQKSTDKHFQTLEKGGSILSDDETLKVAFHDFDTEKGIIYFKVTDSLSQESDVLKFQI
jgi:hypothetical protein